MDYFSVLKSYLKLWLLLLNGTWKHMTTGNEEILIVEGIRGK
jgi:hypothetical protein